MNAFAITMGLAGGLALASSALAQDPITLEQIEQIEGQQKFETLLNQAETLLNQMDRQFKLDCAKAVGYDPFCNCLSKEIPSAWSFSDYVAITTRSKDQNNYSKLDKEYRAAYDLVPGVRNKCVKVINKKP